MFFKKSPRYPIYHALPPFVSEVFSPQDLHGYLHLSETHTTERESVDFQIIKWAIDNEIVIHGDTMSRYPDHQGGSYRHIIQYFNFRTLRSRVERQKVISSITGEFGYDPMSSLLELHTRIGALANPHLLDCIITKLYTSLDAIPIPIDAKLDGYIPLIDTHIEYPYLWLMPYMQMLINDRVNMKYS